ncbi:hypothetical protein MMC28_006574 [Mycoblastus sanguinarius]|nr:hypothetical protein [Mycoblastus sanguinarius]
MTDEPNTWLFVPQHDCGANLSVWVLEVVFDFIESLTDGPEKETGIEVSGMPAVAVDLECNGGAEDGFVVGVWVSIAVL